MKTRMHALLERQHFERLRMEFDQAIAKRVAWQARGEGDEQAICRQLVEYCLWNGCNVLILGGDDGRRGAILATQPSTAYVA